MPGMKRGQGERTVRARIDGLDWQEVEGSLARLGYARSGKALLGAAECRALSSLYADDSLFRSRTDMARHRYGEGEYKYFARPLPPIVEALRRSLYPRLAKIANDWMGKLGEAHRYPPGLDTFLAQCAARGQTRPTPLILRYRTGGYNCLHQDLYGEVAFPLQAMIPLSRPGADYTGGEFLLVEQRPRAQSVATAILPTRGELVIFPNRIRPVEGSRGWYRGNVRHGASRILGGSREALGIIFHDAA
jgi:hypothetical protein